MVIIKAPMDAETPSAEKCFLAADSTERDPVWTKVADIGDQHTTHGSSTVAIWKVALSQSTDLERLCVAFLQDHVERCVRGAGILHFPLCQSSQRLPLAGLDVLGIGDNILNAIGVNAYAFYCNAFLHTLFIVLSFGKPVFCGLFRYSHYRLHMYLHVTSNVPLTQRQGPIQSSGMPSNG